MLLQQQDGLLPLLQPRFQIVDLLLLLQQLLLEAIITLLQGLTEGLRRTEVTAVEKSAVEINRGPACRFLPWKRQAWKPLSQPNKWLLTVTIELDARQIAVCFVFFFLCVIRSHIKMVYRA